MKKFFTSLVALTVLVLGGMQAAHAGASGGPKYNTATVDAYGTDVYTVYLVGGEVAEIGVDGDGYADLDVYVYDENGNLIAYDEDNTADGYVALQPKWTGPFVIKVVNRSNVNSDYTVLTN